MPRQSWQLHSQAAVPDAVLSLGHDGQLLVAVCTVKPSIARCRRLV